MYVLQQNAWLALLHDRSDLFQLAFDIIKCLVYTPLLSMPAPQEQGKLFQIRTLQETDTSITVQVGRGNEMVGLPTLPQTKLSLKSTPNMSACLLLRKKNLSDFVAAWVSPFASRTPQQVAQWLSLPLPNTQTEERSGAIPIPFLRNHRKIPLVADCCI